MTNFDLYVKIRNLYNQAKDMQEQAAKEDRQLTPEERVSFEKYFTDIQAIEQQIEDEKRLAQYESQANDPFYNKDGVKSGKMNGDVGNEFDDAFRKWCMDGAKGLNENERSILNIDKTGRVGINVTKEDRANFASGVEKRTSALANPTYIQPVTLSSMFLETKKAIGQWMEACTQLYTATGETMYIPYINDAGNDGTKEAEGTDAIASSTDITLARQQLDNYWVSSTGLTVGWSELRDASYPVDTFIVQPLLKRLMREISDLATTANGSSTLQGLQAAAVVGETISKSTTPTAADLNYHLKLVDYAYHTAPTSGWMFNSSTMFAIAATVKSSTYNTEPLWQPSLAAGIPSTLYGYKYWINNSMDSIGSNKKPILFGDFSYFFIRWVGPLIISRLEERYAEKGQVGFLVSQYVDSEIGMVGTTYAPIKYMRNLGS